MHDHQHYELIGGPLDGVYIGIDLLNIAVPMYFKFGFVAAPWATSLAWRPTFSTPPSGAPIAYYERDITKPTKYLFVKILTKAQADLV